MNSLPNEILCEICSRLYLIRDMLACRNTNTSLYNAINEYLWKWRAKIQQTHKNIRLSKHYVIHSNMSIWAKNNIITMTLYIASSNELRIMRLNNYTIVIECNGVIQMGPAKINREFHEIFNRVIRKFPELAAIHDLLKKDH